MEYYTEILKEQTTATYNYMDEFYWQNNKTKYKRWQVVGFHLYEVQGQKN